VWEVDVYKGSNAGLITAELEMESLNEEFATPPWVTADVSNNHKFSNSNLVENPFSTWKH
jgi:CYTH domain-containing protein